MARRPINVFSLSFLDCMCCGFGAIILLFMIIAARIEEESDLKLEALESTRQRLAMRVDGGQQQVSELRERLTQALERHAVMALLRERLQLEVGRAGQELKTDRQTNQAATESLESSAQLVQDLEASKRAAEKAGSNLREVAGVGNRQYLTGMRMGGRRILIVVDSSASMLARTLVNVIRRRHLPDEQKLRADKWQQAVNTVDWITAHIPRESEFQIFTFNVTEASLVDDDQRHWVKVGDGSAVEEALDRLRRTVPEGGTSLHSAFRAIRAMQPKPDNVYLLVDGLPTRGKEPPKRSTVTGKERLKHFDRALRSLPTGIPLNIILFAMEGDPESANQYWKLARSTGGSFLSPSKDWP